MAKSALDTADPVFVLSVEFPYTFREDAAQDGDLHMEQTVSGLRTALGSLIDSCDNTTWIAALPDNDLFECCCDLVAKTGEKITAVRVPDKIYDEHIDWINAKHWPILLCMPEKVEELKCTESAWKGSKEFNRRFAQVTFDAVEQELSTASRIGSQPLVWIHDCQLMLVPQLLRQMLLQKSYRCPIGLFLHVPFPAWNIFEQLWHFDRVLQGMLGCDLVSFQTQEFCNNFLDCCARYIECSVNLNAMEIVYQGRIVLVRRTPVGHRYEYFSERSLGELSQKCQLEIRDIVDRKQTDQQLIFGAERLDYSKGLDLRVHAFHRFLEKYPEHDGQVTYLQIAVPTRVTAPGFKNLRQNYEHLVTSTNKKLQEKGFSSRIIAIMEKTSQSDLAILYKTADVALVTPVRDGLNLVAYEYVSCQTSEPGVLILSPFAGAAGYLHEALKADINNMDDMADIMHRAITMPTNERKQRMDRLQGRARQQTVSQWVRSNLETLASM